MSDGLKVTSKILNLDEFKRKMASLKGAARGKTLAEMVMAGGQVVEAQAKVNVNETFSGKASGGAGLAGSIHTELVSSSDTSAEAAIGSGLVYALIHELGGLIKPVKAAMLHFFTYDGQEVFTKLVHMPPRPYLRPALDNSEDAISEAMGAVLEKNIREAAG